LMIVFYSSTGRCANAFGKYGYLWRYSENTDFDENLTVHFSGVLLPSVFLMGYW